MLWQQLRDRKFQNLRFRRQYPYRNFVIDFYCAEHHLALEIDGAIHNDPKQRAHDIDRQLVLESEGIHFIRVSASDVAGNIDGVLHTIALWLGTARLEDQ